MADRESRNAFVKAMEPVKGLRILTVRKTKNPLVRAMGFKIKRFYCEVRVDTGYCVLWAFKDQDATKPVEEFRFIGSNITADVMMDWAEEINVDDPQYRACLVVKGADLKREDGRQLSGELYFFAQDSGKVLQIKQAILALAQSARAPDASCVYGRIGFESVSLKTSEPGTFKLDQDESLQISRACTRIVSLSLVIPGMFGNQAAQADPKAALELLRIPPAMSDADDLDSTTIALTGRALLELLNRLPMKPISPTSFVMFAAQAEKCRLRFEADSEGATRGLFTDSEEFAQVTTTFLRELGSPDAVTLLREVTRAIKHVVYDLRGSVSLLECADVFGPLLVEGYKKPNSREFSWLIASTCSKQRDKIFNRVAVKSPGTNGLVPILRHGKSSSSSHGLNGNEQQQQQKSLGKSVDSNQSPAKTKVASTNKVEVVVSPTSSAAVPVANVVEEASSQSASAKEEPLPSPVESTSMNDINNSNVDSQGSSLIHPSDFEDVQEEIDSLTRLVEYLRTRLRDEPNNPNAHLWRREMQACEAEITALGPTMFFVTSRKEVPSESVLSGSNNTIVDEIKEEEENFNGSINNNSSEFIERTLSLWAESRKEALTGPPEQVSDSTVVLKGTLEDVRGLAQNVDEFPDIAQAQKSTREAAIALVGMLEENINLRLRLLGKGATALEKNASLMTSSTLNNTSVQQTTSSSSSASSSSNALAAATQPSATSSVDVVEVGEEEYEI